MTARLDRLQRGLVEVLDAEFGADARVAWAYGEGLWTASFPEGAIVNLTLKGGPTISGGLHARSTTELLPSDLSFTVGAPVVVSRRYAIEINDFAYAYEAVGGDTVGDVRDALLAAFAVDAEDSLYASAASGADTLDVAPDTVGDVWQVSVTAGISADVTPASTWTQITRSRRAYVVAVELYSSERTLRSGAWSLAERAADALLSPLHAETLARYGVGVGSKSGAIDLSRLDNGHWHSRVQFDLSLTMTSVSTRYVDTLDTVVVDLATFEPSGQSTITVESP